MRLARKETKRVTRGMPRARRKPATPQAKLRAGVKPTAHPAPLTVLYRVCKPGWAVMTEVVPSAPATRFVCPFCPHSHRVPGPVRGFRRVRRPEWLKLRRVFE